MSGNTYVIRRHESRGSSPVAEPVPAGQESGLRSRLTEAGLQAFARYGYEKTTVDDVIRLAGTSRATFYRYFENKRALFHELSGDCFRALRALADRLGALRPEEDARARLKLFLSDYDAVHVRFSGVIRAWTDNVAPHDPQLAEEAGTAFVKLVNAFSGPIDAARMTSDVPTELRAALLYVVVERIHFYAHSQYSEVNIDRLHDTLSVMIQRAFFGEAAPGGSRLRIGGR
ncbi:TetR/AcrR family transcriptional regulator [Actinomadura sp. KC216]|nr:TetR/AcrR family transcriptional regulator [Actinomadura sp. KC216]